MAGSLVLSQAAADALEERNEGIHCADVISMHQPFQKADVLHIYDERGEERARGMCNFSSEEAMLIARNPETPVEELLGFKAERTLVNRKNLVILEDHHLPWEQPSDDPKVIAA
jgi:glutamate 5-kinase